MNSEPRRKMRFLCLGMGAIGTYVGGSLALSGQDVVFLDRPEVAPAVKANGLQIQSVKGVGEVRSPDIVTSIAEAGESAPYQYAILAVKSFDTPALLKSLVPAVDWMPPILCLQNGVENEALVAEVFGAGRIVAGSVTTAIGRKGAGQIVVERLRGIGVAGYQSFIGDLIEVMNAAGLKARRCPDATSMKWSKMLTNLLANASSAILDLPPSAIFAHPGLYRMEIGMLREALAVMEARHIPVCDLPGTPVRLLVTIARRLSPGISRPLLANSLGRGRGAKMPSFHLDLYNGRGQSEVDYLNGAVVRSGLEIGVPTPLNRWLNETLIGMTNGTISKDEFRRNPQKFLSAMARVTSGG